MVLEIGRTGNPWFVGTESLVTLLRTVSWNVENVSKNVTKEISKQSVEGTAWFLFNVYCEMWKES